MADEETSPFDVAAKKIDEILRELVNSHNHEAAPEFLTDWFLVCAAHVDDGTDENGTSYRRLVRPDQPPHITLGLLEYEVTKFRNWLTREE